MSRAYLFIETGEVREPKEGEWIFSNRCLPCFRLATAEDKKSLFFTCHEIDIPEGADYLYVGMESDKGPGYQRTIYSDIEVHRPKRKVKKWRWWTTINGVEVTTSEPFSEDEMVEKNLIWHKVSSSEIEVEE